MGASATTGGNSGAVDVARGTVDSADATAGSAFVGSTGASVLGSFGLELLSALSEKLFFCFLLGKHMGKNGRERELPLA